MLPIFCFLYLPISSFWSGYKLVIILKNFTKLMIIHFLYQYCHLIFKLYFRNNVIACAKHFVGDGGTYKGVNEGNTILSYEELERIHMAPYLDCISQGVSTIMVSYSSWNGRKLHADHFLITEILKNKLGFKVKWS